ncbi:MAG: response regulator [Candidatus Omnitrophica bacterium]|nr:response regulator [Candidatus Omnitrophota bacterium]
MADNYNEIYQGKMVLVVDDLAPNWKLANAFLKKFGCESEYAQNGKEAVEKLMLQKYDLCLMDIHMPVMDGFDAIKYIRSNITNEMPIVVMLGTATQADYERAISLGANGSCEKPLSMDRIQRVLDRFVT